MLELVRTARPVAVALALSATLAACSDDDNPTGVLNPQAVEATADAAEEIVAPVLDDPNLMVNLTMAYGAFDFAGPTPVAMLGAMRDGSVSVAELRGLRASSPQRGPVVPDELYGSTFVYNVELGDYEVDPDATGAPETGVRVMYYAVDPLTYDYVQPLVPVGHIDFADASTEGSYRLDVDVVSDASGTLADYFVAMSGNETEGTIELEGFLSDGSEQVDFDIRMAGTETATQTTGDWDFTISNDAQNASIIMDATSVGDDQGSELDATFTVRHGSNAAVFRIDEVYELVGDDFVGTVDGTLSYNGATVVEISGDAAEPTFTRPGGEALTQREVAALFRVWGMYATSVLLTIQLIAPFAFFVAF